MDERELVRILDRIGIDFRAQVNNMNVEEPTDDPTVALCALVAVAFGSGFFVPVEYCGWSMAAGLLLTAVIAIAGVAENRRITLARDAQWNLRYEMGVAMIDVVTSLTGRAEASPEPPLEPARLVPVNRNGQREGALLMGDPLRVHVGDEAFLRRQVATIATKAANGDPVFSRADWVGDTNRYTPFLRTMIGAGYAEEVVCDDGNTRTQLTGAGVTWLLRAFGASPHPA